MLPPEAEALMKLREDAADYFQGIVDAVYSQEPLDKDELHHCMEELCFLMGISLPDGDMQIEPKKYRDYKRD